MVFPPRVFGDEPYPGAGDDVASAFAAVIAPPVVDRERRAAHLEAPDEVVPILEQLGGQYRHITAGVRVARVRFLAPDRALVQFTVLLRHGGGQTFDGRAVRRGGTWLVTRDTVLSIIPAHPPFVGAGRTALVMERPADTADTGDDET